MWTSSQGQTAISCLPVSQQRRLPDSPRLRPRREEKVNLHPQMGTKAISPEEDIRCLLHHTGCRLLV